MNNFIGMVFATLKKAGIETKNLTADEAIAKYNELEQTVNKEKPKEQSNAKETLTSKSNDATIKLDKQEYAIVAQTLATKFKNKTVPITTIDIGNYMYVVADIEPGNFSVKLKIDIEKYRDELELLEGKDDNGNK